MAGILLATYKPQSIPIMIDPKSDQIRKHFRCPTCGRIVFDYFGGVKLLMNGEANDDIDRDGRIVRGGAEVDWLDTVGEPFILECSGRLQVYRADGSPMRIPCKTKFLKIGL